MRGTGKGTIRARVRFDPFPICYRFDAIVYIVLCDFEDRRPLRDDAYQPCQFSLFRFKRRRRYKDKSVEALAPCNRIVEVFDMIRVYEIDYLSTLPELSQPWQHACGKKATELIGSLVSK